VGERLMPDIVQQGKTSSTGIPAAYRKGTDDQKNLEVFSSRGSARLESQEYQERFRKLLQWWRQARQAQADNRVEQAVDEDYYDGIQLTDEEIQVLLDRNQPIQIYNITKHMLNWILGTERKARIDFRALPRKKTGARSAKAKTKVIKYIQDMCKGEYERSFAFEEAVKAGLGWIEVGARHSGECPIFFRAERWRNMWFDHLGLSLDGSDWRFIFRQKWVDLDVAQSMFPDRAEDLKNYSQTLNSIYPFLPGDAVPDPASEFDMESAFDPLGGRYDDSRERVKMIECCYRVPAQVQVMRARRDDTPYGALDGAIFRKEHADHQYLVRGNYFSLEDIRKMTVRFAMWAGPLYLQDELTPYNHDQFPFIPVFCYRRRRDNMPYGVIRDIRDPQSDLNKRRSRALALLTANRVIYEKGAIDDPAKTYEEVQRVDGMVELNVGGKRFEIVKEAQLAQEHVNLAQDDERFIRDIMGVSMYSAEATRKDMSGKAITALEQQSQTASGVYFDNYYYSFQSLGERLISLTEQFIDQEQEFRVTGDQRKDEFIKVNERLRDGKTRNAVQESKADFVISKQDYRETIRLASQQMLSEIIMSLAKSGMGQMALKLLDLFFDGQDDLPNKDEIVARIRKVTGEAAPDDDATPEERAARQKTEQAAAQDAQRLKALTQATAEAVLAVKQAEAAGKDAKALKDRVDAEAKKLESFLKALEAAGAIKVAPDLVEAADALLEEAQSAGEPTDQASQTPPPQIGGQP
jgi:hypothetical protein